MKRLFTLVLMTLGLSACTSFDFADNSEGASHAGFNGFNSFDDSSETSYLKKINGVKTLGTLTVSSFGKASEDKNPAVYTIKREKSKIFAERTLFTSDNKEKTFFDETMLNLGLDKKQKGFSVEFSLKF